MEKGYYQIFACNSKASEGYIRVVDGKVCCDSKKDDKKTICRRYLGGDSGNMVAFEYIDEKSQPTMVSVGANKKLLPRKKTKSYNNWSDIEKELKFFYKSEELVVKLYRETDGNYVGFVKNSKDFQLCIVDASSQGETFVWKEVDKSIGDTLFENHEQSKKKFTKMENSRTPWTQERMT